MLIDKKINSWAKSQLGGHSISNRMWPSEAMLRSIFSSRYFNLSTDISPGMNVLDIGCLYTNNLLPFSDRDFNLYGVEINSEMIQLSNEMATRNNLDIDIREGNNRALPFEDGFFDIILSLNTIHYENNRDGIIRALSEFKRVGNTGTTFIISSVGSKHAFYSSAKRLDENQYVLNVSDFRNSQTMSYFDDKNHFCNTLQMIFDQVEIATVTEEWPKATYQFYFAKCKN